MKNLKFVMIAAVCGLFVLNSCTKEQLAENFDEAGIVALKASEDASRTLADACGDALVVDFLAGQHNDAGDVQIYNDAETLSVCVEIHDGWTMTQSHLYLGEDVPKKFAPGQFGNATDHGDGVTSFCYEFATADLPECYVIAFHAEVEGTEGSGNSAETAWAAGTESGKNWSMYNEYCTQECEPDECFFDSGASQLPTSCNAQIIGFDASAGYSISYTVVTDAGETFTGDGAFYDQLASGAAFQTATITFVLTNADGCTDTIEFEVLTC